MSKLYRIVINSIYYVKANSKSEAIEKYESDDYEFSKYDLNSIHQSNISELTNDMSDSSKIFGNLVIED